MTASPRPRRVRYGDRDWTHPSVHALMEGVPANRTPVDVVSQHARKMADEVRPYGWAGPPFDPLLLIDLQGIKAREVRGAMDHDAMISVLPDGELEIVWDGDAPVTRRNFSLCHEVGHTLFPDCFELVRYRRERTQRDPDRELELLCDVAASELLMPLLEFQSDFEERGFNAGAITALGDRYIASQEAVARRAVQLSQGKRAAVVMTLRNKPSDKVNDEQTGFSFYEAPPMKLRVDYCVGSPSLGRFVVPKHKSPPDDSCVYSSLPGPAAEETWFFQGRERTCRVESIRLPRTLGGEQRVLVLLTPK